MPTAYISQHRKRTIYIGSKIFAFSEGYLIVNDESDVAILDELIADMKRRTGKSDFDKIIPKAKIEAPIEAPIGEQHEEVVEEPLVKKKGKKKNESA